MKGCDFIINQFGKTGEKKKYYNDSLEGNNVLKTNITSNQLEPHKTTNKRNSNLLSDYQPKAFKSSYINDNGKWTQKAVNDGFVKFDDYISDIKADTSNYVSFNNKPLKISGSNDIYLGEMPGFNGLSGKYEPFNLPNWAENGKKFVRDAANEIETNTRKSIDSIGNRINEGQKEAQRKVWKLGAELYLRKKCGFLTSAWMLEHSLEDNPEDIERDNNSRIAYLINHDNAYLSKLDEAIKNSKDGTISGYLKDVYFEDGDLYYSIHSASIYVDGYQQSNGKWLVKAKLTDVYDFTKIQTLMDEDGEFSLEAGLGTVANDVAVVSQLLGAITPYNVTVEFYTTR